MFERVWQGVHSAGGLADTPLLSSVLLTSGLSTDTLGYIWSLANHTVPGALTQSEVYLVLALVGLAQVSLSPTVYLLWKLILELANEKSNLVFSYLHYSYNSFSKGILKILFINKIYSQIVH